MPGCTLKETMYKFNECYEKFYSNFPYQNQDVCGSRRTELFQCLSRTYSTCLSGRCPTVLDQIPGTRSFYPVRFYNSISMLFCFIVFKIFFFLKIYKSMFIKENLEYKKKSTLTNKDIFNYGLISVSLCVTF